MKNLHSGEHAERSTQKCTFPDLPSTLKASNKYWELTMCGAAFTTQKVLCEKNEHSMIKKAQK